MKKALLTYLLMNLIVVTAMGQTEVDTIKKTFNTYFKTVKEKDNAKTLEHIYPKLFDIRPKKTVLDAMNKASSDTSTVITIEDATISKVSQPETIEGVKYSLIDYTFKMTMEINFGDNNNSEAVQLTLDLLKGTYGKKNVTLDKTNSTFHIQLLNQMYAIKDPAYSGWKFLEKKDHLKPVLEKILPKKVLKM